MLVETHLRDAAVALSDGRELEGFRHLLDAYKSARTPELAEAVITVGERLAPRHPGDPHLCAPATYAAVRSADEFLVLNDPTYALWGDPRVEAIGLRWVEEAYFSSVGSAASAYIRIIDSLSGGGNPSVVSRLSALFERVRVESTHPLRRELVLRALARAATKERKPPPPLQADARLFLDSIVNNGPLPAGPMAAAKSGDELLAAVWADPDSDEPRLMYADWLSERGDPRGEIIVAQCERARRGGGAPDARETKLISDHITGWMGPLAGPLIANPQSARFERGFVAAGVLSYANAQTDFALAAIGHPAWSTVVELACFGANQRGERAAPLLLDGSMRSLRIVRDVAMEDAARLAESDLSSLRWTTLGITAAYGNRFGYVELVARLDGLPALETLALGWLSVDDLEVTLATRVGGRLRVLAVDGPEPLPGWAEAARRVLGRGPLVELHHEGFRHRVTFALHPAGGLAVTAAMGPYARVPDYIGELLLLAPDEQGVASLTLLRPQRRRKGKDAKILDGLKEAFGARLSIEDLG